MDSVFPVNNFYSWLLAINSNRGNARETYPCCEEDIIPRFKSRSRYLEKTLEVIPSFLHPSTWNAKAYPFVICSSFFACT